MLIGGIPFRPPRRLHARVWILTVGVFRYLCMGVCLTRFVYATGPSFTDHFSCAVVVYLHVHLIFGSKRLLHVLKSSTVIRRLLHEARYDALLS